MWEAKCVEGSGEEVEDRGAVGEGWRGGGGEGEKQEEEEDEEENDGREWSWGIIGEFKVDEEECRIESTYTA